MKDVFIQDIWNYHYYIGDWFMVLNANFNNILVILWRSVLLVEETRVPEKTTDLSQVTDKLYHIMLYEYTSSWRDPTQNFSVDKH